ncbi:MAG: hypothetical protein E7515_04540 [Ruminococcaceae bacterium]|jgi:cytoskeletal protein RodZ|nr:hypothetical protein [Oscillospiraceae bacterium]
MAKKEKTPLTFEELAREKERKEAKSKLFQRTFLKAFALISAFAIIFFTVMIAFTPEIIPTYKPFVVSSGQASSGTSAVTPASNTTPTPAAPADSSSSSDSNKSADNQSTTPADNSTPADNNAGQNDDVLATFNEAINKVKTEAKAITHVSGGTKNNGGIDDASKMPGIIKAAGNGIINAAMSSNGVKNDGSVIGSADFPVENQTYSSQLTADDVVSATRNGNTITIVIKDDELGQADNGHCAKAMNVIKASTIMENIPSVASSIAREAKTSAKSATIVATLDDNGHVVAADYSFNWDIEIIGNSLDAIIHLASEEHYTMTY